MLGGSDDDKHREANPDFHGIEDRHPLTYDAVAFQPVYAVPAGIRGEVDLPGDFRQRLRRVCLQTIQDPDIDGVQRRHAKLSQWLPFV